MRYIFALLTLLITSNLAWAQKAPIDIKLNPTSGTVSDQFFLTIRFLDTDSTNLSKPTFPESEQFAIRLVNQSFETNITNGQSSSTAVLAYRIFPNQQLKPGEYSLPDFTITVNGTSYPVVGPKLTIVAQSSSEANETDSDSDVSFRQVVDTTKPFVGQQVTYRAKLLTGGRFVRGDLGEVTIPNSLREDLGHAKQRTKRVGDKYLTLVSEVVIPTKPGKIHIPPRKLTAVMRGDVRRRRSILDFDPLDPLARPFSRQALEKVYSSNSLELDVRPLPPAPDGIDGYIPVGNIKISTNVKQKKVAVGESTTITIELFGKANLRPYQLPKLDKEMSDAKLYFDQPQLTTSVNGDKIVYRKKFPIAIVPTRPGEISIPQFSVTYFDPLRSKYFTKSTAALTIKAVGDAISDPDIELREESEQNEVIGDGLYPQHEGPELYASYHALSSRLIVVYIILLPLISISLRVYLGYRQQLRDPKRRAKDSALKDAMQSLNSPPIDVDAAWNTLSLFLRNRGVLKSDSFDLNSAKVALAEANLSENLQNDTAKFIEMLTLKRYSGQAQTQLEQNALDSLRRILESIDKEAN